MIHTGLTRTAVPAKEIIYTPSTISQQDQKADKENRRTITQQDNYTPN
jgi:hypothetical protein